MQVHLELCGTQDMMISFSFAAPFKPGLVRCLIYLVLEGVHKYTNIGLAMGVKIGRDSAKSGNNTHLLVIICVRILQKIGLLDLMNLNRFKKENG